FMSYISEIFDRLDVQNIREFLLRGVECPEINPMGYQERLELAETKVREQIRKRYPKLQEDEDLMDRVLSYGSETEDVYMEIGLQCGFILAMRLFKNTDRKEV
ncbi:hypothetical protein NE619_18325, partial [Anaerovorax odorimutans]